MDTSSSLNVINQDDTFFQNAAFANNDVVSYTSTSVLLDTYLTLDEQTDLVPGGASLLIFGEAADGTVVWTRLAWFYNMTGCDVENIQGGDRLGWITFHVSESSTWSWSWLGGLI